MGARGLEIVVHICNLSIWETEVQGHPWLYSEFQASLDYVRSCLKQKPNNKSRYSPVVEDQSYVLLHARQKLSHCAVPPAKSLFLLIIRMLKNVHTQNKINRTG